MLKPNKRAVGAFIISGLILAIAALLFFFGGRLMRNEITPVLFFEGSVSGLSVGSQVYFRGVPVGKVEKIQLMPNSEDKIIIPVYITFDPKVMTNAKPVYIKELKIISVSKNKNNKPIDLFASK